MNRDWRFIRLVPAILVMVVIFILSHQPGSSLHLPAVPYIDKAGHFMLYCLLAGTVLYAAPIAFRRGHLLRTAALVVLVCIGYGVSDELHQLFIPGREASVADVFADFLGAAALVSLWFRQQSQRELPLTDARMDKTIHQRY